MKGDEIPSEEILYFFPPDEDTGAELVAFIEFVYWPTGSWTKRPL